MSGIGEREGKNAESRAGVLLVSSRFSAGSTVISVSIMDASDMTRMRPINAAEGLRRRSENRGGAGGNTGIGLGKTGFGWRKSINVCWTAQFCLFLGLRMVCDAQ